jgi:hypothetical protein
MFEKKVLKWAIRFVFMHHVVKFVQFSIGF